MCKYTHMDNPLQNSIQCSMMSVQATQWKLANLENTNLVSRLKNYYIVTLF